MAKESLGLEKQAINETQDIQGFSGAIAVGIEIDSIGHLAEPVLEINRQIRERGLRPTIEARSAGELDLEFGRRPQGRRGHNASRDHWQLRADRHGPPRPPRGGRAEVLSVLRGPEDDPGRVLGPG